MCIRIIDQRQAEAFGEVVGAGAAEPVMLHGQDARATALEQ